MLFKPPILNLPDNIDRFHFFLTLVRQQQNQHSAQLQNGTSKVTGYVSKGLPTYKSKLFNHTIRDIKLSLNISPFYHLLAKVDSDCTLPI